MRRASFSAGSRAPRRRRWFGRGRASRGRRNYGVCSTWWTTSHGPVGGAGGPHAARELGRQPGRSKGGGERAEAEVEVEVEVEVRVKRWTEGDLGRRQSQAHPLPAIRVERSGI